MDFYQEKIETDSVIPARIYVARAEEKHGHYPLHWHDHLEFDLVLEGAIFGKINGRTVAVCPGEFFFVNSGELHETDADDRQPLSSVTLLLSYDLLREYFPDAAEYRFDFSGNAGAQARVKALLLECAEIYRTKGEFYALELSIALREICVVLLTECRKKRSENAVSRTAQKNIQNLKRAIAYMEERHGDTISLQEIAGEIGMSPPYFSRFFKKATGRTFYAYRMSIRLYYAHRELMNSDETITVIALNNGFPNVKAFIEAFKEEYGVTPAKYRKSTQG